MFQFAAHCKGSASAFFGFRGAGKSSHTYPYLKATPPSSRGPEAVDRGWVAPQRNSASGDRQEGSPGLDGWQPLSAPAPTWLRKEGGTWLLEPTFLSFTL